MPLSKNQKGFTLIETTVYIGLLTMVLAAVFSFFIWDIKTGRHISSSRDSLSASRHILDILSEEISTASGIYTPTTNSSQLSLTTNYNISEGEETAFVDFFKCGANLCRKREGSDAEALMPDSAILDEIVFTPISASSTPAVAVFLRISSSSLGLSAVYSGTTTIALRAY